MTRIQFSHHHHHHPD
ncbi:TPA: his operon leader peptide [Morganella morganii]|uniref:his operon leader peptide n=9 Tax=Bacteria TaxID=2 RepID=A0A515D4X8_SERLI|nr:MULTISPECIES: his operon leader peptide [Enterobacterales]MDW5506120.1 his operon leader peptide [Pseudomonas lundensis]HAE79024.1 histidine operon leader peptide [Morganella sp. (in: enterobacteria)]HAS8349834.1 his operon leader peptide [Vibrio vulnificus]HDU8308829.1 his operon leader peptide [Morganella morganii subsp. sibonii]HEN1305916.1 his operon leader peptide [Klebsiella pneumoniae]